MQTNRLCAFTQGFEYYRARNDVPPNIAWDIFRQNCPNDNKIDHMIMCFLEVIRIIKG